jgi:L-ascorbate metabolism protein UlaG (beta-lactamase superfamily)
MVDGALGPRGAGASQDRIVFLGHSTLLVELDGVRVLTDPLLRGRVAHLRRQVAAVDRTIGADPAAVLISHIHHDHLDLPSLRELGRGTPLAVPTGAGAWLGRKGFTNVTEMSVGDTTSFGALTVTAVPARHGGSRLPGVVRAVTLGYLLESRTSVYFAGDTTLFDGMSGLAPRLDVALLPVAGWAPRLGPGHMDSLQAARAAALLRPRIAIPIHWGTLLPIGMSSRHRATLGDPPRLFAEHVARLAAGVEVCILSPGEEIAL